MARRFSGEQVRDYKDREEVFAEGAPSRELFVIGEGEVLIHTVVDGQRVVLARLERGAIFGEMALLTGSPRSATATADGPARLVVVQPGGFLLKIRRDPTFAYELMQQMARRIKRTNETLSWALTQSQDVAPEEALRQILDDPYGEVEPGEGGT
jgi:CRP/FNR family cyclic AMP-dependent transcriptional regulator